MAYQTLLVLLDTDARCTTRLEIAADLAKLHGAHLIALSVNGHVLPPLADLFSSPVDMSVVAKRAAQTEALVHKVKGQLTKWGVQSFSVRTDHDDPLSAVVRYARHCDLLVLPQTDALDDGTRLPPELAEQVLLQASRPVLLIPPRGHLKMQSEHAIIAWDGSGPARRALSDALPLLTHVRQVELLCVDPPRESLFSRLELNDLRHWLQRHGVHTLLRQVTVDGSVGDTLLRVVAHSSCDLLVMGGYGHPRTLERVFGGVTRKVLTAMPVPLLISH